MRDEEEPRTPSVPWIKLWPDFLGLLAALFIMGLLLLCDLAERKPDLFQRSGTIALFIVVVLQFKHLSELNQKHINNAKRARVGGAILEISVERTHVGWITLVVASLGAIVNAFGDKFVHVLVRLYF